MAGYRSSDASRVTCHDTIGNGWARSPAEDRAAAGVCMIVAALLLRAIAVDDAHASDRGAGALPGVEPKAPVWLSQRPFAVDDRTGRYVRIIRDRTAHRDSLAAEVEVAVAVPHVRADRDHHFVAWVSCINRLLDCGVLRGHIEHVRGGSPG